jgi:hypothetical protein
MVKLDVMEGKQTALIVIDDAESTWSMAQTVSAVLDDYETVLRRVDAFSGIDLLPADVFFLGCAESHPFGFIYLEDMFKHINLAGRRCGIFSVNDAALKYLSDMVKDSEAVMGKPFLASDSAIDSEMLQKWVRSILVPGGGYGSVKS